MKTTPIVTPRGPKEGPEEDRLASEDLAAGARAAPKRILLVDDDRMLLGLLTTAIARRLESVVVEACASPFEALRTLEARDVDVVVSDLLMGGLHGLDLLDRVRSLRPNALVVLITGAADRDLAVRALRGGAYDFIQKPVDPDYLTACIRRAIETRELRAEVERQQRALRRHAEDLERTVAVRTEELRRASRAKDEFLATISHELRTPLTAILGWARLLVAGKLDAAEEAQAIQSIAKNAKAQAQLIDDLLDVSRIITGKMRIEVREVNLASVIEGALGAILPAAQAKGITIERQIELLDRVLGDANRLGQVLWNLLSNAVKFTPPGGHLAVRVRGRGASVEIEVTDDGAGIELDLIPHVFERFRQGSAQLTSRRGLGLGLAIARHLTELHGGTVTAESDGPGRGATFRVTLPSRAPDDSRPREPFGSSSAVALDAAEDCLRGVRVLVVDDDADTRHVLHFMLEHAGAEVDLAASAEEAKAAVQRARPVLLLCDLGLGSEDGCALLRALRASTEGAVDAMHAVALTAHARSEDRAHALASGFELHIAKPGPADLPRVLASLLTQD
jgi:signal transduction histidine kinase